MLKLEVTPAKVLYFPTISPTERIRKIGAFRDALAHLRSISLSIKAKLAGCGYSAHALDSTANDMRGRLKDYRHALSASDTKTVYQLTWERNGLNATSRYTATADESRIAVLSHLLEEVRGQIREKRRDRKAVYTYRKRYYRVGSFDVIGADADGCGGVHKNAGDVLKAYQTKKAIRINEQKFPKTDARYVGIELEFCSPEDDMTVKAALSAAGLADWLTLKGDGSVSPDEDGEHAYEVNILATESEYRAIVERTCAVISGLGGYVNTSCGFHTHLDMRNRDLATAYRNLVASQTILYKMVPASRKSNQYCKPTRGRTFPRSRRVSRYKGINPKAYREHKTLEVRIHSGTLNAAKVNNWIALLILIADAPAVEGRMSSVSTWAAHVGMPAELRAYVASRIATFAPARPADAQAAQSASVTAYTPAPMDAEDAAVASRAA